MPEYEYPHAQFLDDLPAKWAQEAPEAEAITYLSRTWTFAELDDRVRRLAGALAERGIGRGDVVAFLDKNHPACVELSLAAGSLGAANAIINFRLAAAEIDYALNDSGAKLLVVGEELLPMVDKVRDRLDRLEHVVAVTPEGTEGDQYEAMLAAAGPLAHSEEADPDDTVLVMYSSGTTGYPKGVMLSHRQMLAHTQNAHEGWGFEPGDKSMVSMPLFHVGGSSYVLFSIADGVPSYMTRDADGEKLMGAIVAGANRTFLVPAVLAQVLQAGDRAIALFGRLKTYTYGASPMPQPLLRAALAAWPDTDFIQVYGLTEVCGVATHLMPEDHREAVATGNWERVLSAGRALPGVEVRVVDPGTLEEVPVGEHGEIWLRTEQLMTGYLGKPEETAKVVTQEGWFRTGDMGHVDEDGYVFVQDRLKDMIISGGENIYSPEVERVLAEHPAVAEVAVIGVPDEQWGEVVKAVVSLRPGQEVTPQDLIAHCHEQLAAFKCPRSVDIVDALPRNPTGKILKRDLRAPYWTDRDSAVV